MQKQKTGVSYAATKNCLRLDKFETPETVETTSTTKETVLSGTTAKTQVETFFEANVHKE